mmetsp:Transcript_8725/g.39673  ORF Transcript_8725/g.39673 Transcript_8725/m.39673 type:complete len:406 (-) Transcript_8725:845-2062(-)
MHELFTVDAALLELDPGGDDVHLPVFNRSRCVGRPPAATPTARAHEVRRSTRDKHPVRFIPVVTAVEQEGIIDRGPGIHAQRHDDRDPLERSREPQRRRPEAQTGDAGFPEPHSLVPVEQSPGVYVAAVHERRLARERVQAQPVAVVIRPRLYQVTRVDVDDVVGDEVKVGRRHRDRGSQRRRRRRRYGRTPDAGVDAQPPVRGGYVHRRAPHVWPRVYVRLPSFPRAFPRRQRRLKPPGRGTPLAPRRRVVVYERQRGPRPCDVHQRRRAPRPVAVADGHLRGGSLGPRGRDACDLAGRHPRPADLVDGVLVRESHAQVRGPDEAAASDRHRRSAGDVPLRRLEPGDSGRAHETVRRRAEPRKLDSATRNRAPRRRQCPKAARRCPRYRVPDITRRLTRRPARE